MNSLDIIELIWVFIFDYEVLHDHFKNNFNFMNLVTKIEMHHILY